jgi:hypothetical protein
MNVVRKSKSFEGGKEHDICFPESPYYNKKNTYEENVNVVINSFHNRCFMCKKRLCYLYISLSIDVKSIKQNREAWLLLIAFWLKTKVKSAKERLVV